MMNTLPPPNFDLTHFNPGQQDEASFIANFIARQAELGRFMNELRHTPSTQAVHHHLIVAPRGYGKTSLLRRICIAARQDEQLKNQFIALTDRKSTRLNSSHSTLSRMPSSA